MKRVLVGMSGGVDSSAAIILLQEQGYEVVGVSFKFIDDFDETDAKRVANILNIEYHILDYRKEFKEKIIDKFIEEYQQGNTPNPCIRCNRYCKFKYLIDNMKTYNCDYIATGHYANINNGKLHKSIDLNKDQSYFLYNIPKEYLEKIIFPLEGLTKDKVKEIANRKNLGVSSKKESFDVCFINSSFKEYMKSNSKQKQGDVINVDTGKKIGTHQGLTNYTIGQRKGLNIGGTEDKMYVVDKDIEKNILYICLGDKNEDLVSTSCALKAVNLLVDELPIKCKAKFRYRQQDIPVELEWKDNNEILVKYPQGVKSVTPGQACVFYDGEECLGGGIIKEVRRDNKKLWYL